jgi:hypothetical protein
MSEDAPQPRFRFPFRSRGGQPTLAAEPVEILADFESGNAMGSSVVSPAHVRFSARPDSSPRPLWFYFCVQGSTAPAIRCELRNADQCLGPRLGWRTARPVFSADGRSWQRVARSEYVEEATDFGYFSFTVPVVGRRTFVAYCYPYTTADLETLTQPLSRQRFELCRSPEDRPVPYLRLGNHQSPKKSVWILARQHAGETPASYVAEGIVRTLAGSDLPSLESTAYHVIPLLDVDGVFHGRYGKDEEPVDFNRDWRDHPVRPEIIALQRAIRAAHHQAPISCVIDLHAPHHGDTSCYAFGNPAGDSKGAELQTSLIRYLANEGPETVGFRETDLRNDYRPERSAREYLARTLDVPVITFEISYHLAQSERYLTQSDYRDFGSAIARGLDKTI